LFLPCLVHSPFFPPLPIESQLKMTEVIRHRVHIDADEEEPQTVEDFLQESEVRLETDFSCVVVVDNLPVVGQDRYPKFRMY